MKILIFGNGESYQFGLEQKIGYQFAKQGHKTYIVCNNKNKHIDFYSIPQHKNLYKITADNSSYSYGDLSILEDTIDVVFGINETVAPFVADYKKKKCIKGFCMFLNFPSHAIDGHDPVHYDFDLSQKFYYWLNCSLDLDGVIFNTSVHADEFFKRYKRTGHIVLFSTCELNNYDKVKEKDPTKDYTYGCYSIRNIKSADLTLYAISDKNYEYRHSYTFYNTDSLNGFKRYAESMSNKVVIYQSPSDKLNLNLLYNARIIIYPQQNNWAFGKSVIEGMSVKTPSIVMDYPILREVYGNCSLYAKPNNIEDFRNKITMLYEDSDLNKELSIRGHNRFKSKLNIENMAKNILDIMEK